MKLDSVPIAAVLATTTSLTLFPSLDAYMYSVGPNNCRPPSSSFRSRDSFSSSPRSNRYRQRQQRVDQAFRDLQKEMNEASRRQQQRRRGTNQPQTGQFDFMMMDPFSMDFQDVDQQAVKKWVDKAFDLATEFNQDFSRSSQVREKNDEFLKQSREWVEKNMYQTKTSDEKETETTSDANDDVTTSTAEQDGTTSPSMDTVTVKDQENPETTVSPTPEEPEVVTPYSENRSNDEVFQVAVDLPGVEREDVDLTLEKDFLVVEAQRRPREEEASDVTRTYVKKFAVLEDEIEVEQIEASLSNGVLTVSAPKKKIEEKETKIKIPLV